MPEHRNVPPPQTAAYPVDPEHPAAEVVDLLHTLFHPLDEGEWLRDWIRADASLRCDMERALHAAAS